MTEKFRKNLEKRFVENANDKAVHKNLFNDYVL